MYFTGVPNTLKREVNLGDWCVMGSLHTFKSLHDVICNVSPVHISSVHQVVQCFLHARTHKISPDLTKAQYCLSIAADQV